MTEPGQSEICKEHSRKVDELNTAFHNNREILIKLSSDIEHVKGRIDNGLSQTVTKIWEKINDMSQKMVSSEAMVVENNKWIERLKNAFVWIGITAIGGGLIALAMKMIEGK